MSSPAQPRHANAALVLADGSIFFGKGIGCFGEISGEMCFNTSLTGYQEIMTDPSYAGQIVTFTYPHIGNTGVNAQDDESERPRARGLVLRTDITTPSNYRSEVSFDGWLRRHGLTGVCGVDTRALTQHLRDRGAQNGVIAYAENGVLDIAELRARAAALPAMQGADLAAEVSTPQPYVWTEGVWNPQTGGFDTPASRVADIVVVDYGVKRNILRCLAAQGFRLHVVPCTMSAAEILALNPAGIFLSNGPGDPAATGLYAVPVIQDLLKSGLPVFGICLGHQLLALALGAQTAKLPFGHRGGNHPVKDLATGKVEITSQNHGFHVVADTLPAGVTSTHISLFDGTNEGISFRGGTVFSVQYHPEASPGPQDSHYLFARFAALVQQSMKKAA